MQRTALAEEMSDASSAGNQSMFQSFNNMVSRQVKHIDKNRMGAGGITPKLVPRGKNNIRK